MKIKESVINRRKAFGQVLGLAGVLLCHRVVSAETTPVPNPPVCPEPIKMVKVIESEISSNHGHGFKIKLSELINSNGEKLTIQGTSGHPHTIVISNDQIIALMKGEVVAVDSSKDAGHTHKVKLVLAEQPEQKD